MYLKLNAVWLSGKGDTYTIWAVLCMCVSEGCRDVSYRVLWRGCGFGWRRHVQDLGVFCVRVCRKVVGMWHTWCCGGDAVSGGGDTYRIRAVFVYVCVRRLSGCVLQGAVEGMRFRVEETRTRFGRFLCTCVVGEWFLCTSVWYRCRVVIYRVWEEGAFLVCYTKKKEITILVIPHEISLRYVLEESS